MSTFRSVLIAALFALLPATAAGSLDATLVVTLTPVAHSGELTESGLEGEDVSLDGLDPLVVNVVMTYPFRLETLGSRSPRTICSSTPWAGTRPST
jgi:hypothetical protein